ncbi:MAG: EI24 domain-containing protein, partial [Candidatus Sedimenticola endophacoides]
MNEKMKNNPIIGFNYLLQGLKLLLEPGLKRYLVVPLLINFTIFSLVGWIGYSQFEALLAWLLPEQSWYSFLRWLLWPLFALTILLVTFYTFTVVANLIAAPFNSLLAQRVEQILTGSPPPPRRRTVACPDRPGPGLGTSQAGLLYYPRHSVADIIHHPRGKPFRGLQENLWVVKHAPGGDCRRAGLNRASRP